MAELTLIPTPLHAHGERGDDLRVAYLERGAALCLELEQKLMDHPEKSLMAWFDSLEEANQTPTIAELRQIVEKIYGQTTKIHTSIVNARSARKSGSA